MIKKRYYYLMDGMDENLPISQYMDLDYLLRLLGSRSYHVKAKELFPDKRESSLPLKSIFRLQPVKPGNYKGCGSTSPEESLKKYREYKESGAFLTACWTEREGESALMWANFTTKMGVCIKSTIHNFIASFENDDYEIYCGRMSYNGYNAEQDIMESLFSKQKAYYEEKEIRFYFMRKDDTDLSKRVNIPVNPSVLISEIILSPNIETKAREELSRFIMQTYKIEVKSSKIEV